MSDHLASPYVTPRLAREVLWEWAADRRRRDALDAAVTHVAKRLYGKDWREVMQEWLTREPLFTTRRMIVREFNEIVSEGPCAGFSTGSHQPRFGT